jgi:hypothetical protein
MLHLAPSQDPAELCSAVATAARSRSVLWLERLPDGLASPDVTFTCSVEAAPADFTSLSAIVDDVSEYLDAASSVALEGTDHRLIEAGRVPIRYQYLMRRRHDFSHDDYLTRYLDIHSKFGIATPGIEGYTQFHVDPEASADLAARTGLGTSDFDSVSELHLESLEKFFAALVDSDVGAEAVADEELFVDRPNSAMYTSTVHNS